MSHFTVGVISKENHSIESILERYDENLRTEPYIVQTKEETIQLIRDAQKRNYETRYIEYIKNPEEYAKKVSQASIKYLEEGLLKEINMSDDDLFLNFKKEEGEEYFDERENLTSTYNPDAKWDWWLIGGRWSGSLLIKKDNEDYKIGEPGFFTGESLEKEVPDGLKWVDSAKIKDINFDLMGDYETFALLIAKEDEGEEWIEPGEMGWWGIDTANQDSKEDYLKQFKEVINSEEYQDYYFTVVDCHI